MKNRFDQLLLIFLTGAAVLALELLSSRIMTPYFGVSLYIWSGILSITLTFLAIGYYLGGYISRKLSRNRQTTLFYSLPICSALSILFSAVIYPFLFPWLALQNLVVGSFLASAVLLAVPLIFLSGMNPLLVAIGKRERGSGDSGAGTVFFVSTLGSVGGVLVTAFAIIPVMTNFSAILWLSLFLCLSSGTMALGLGGLGVRQRYFVASCALAISTASIVFLSLRDSYLDLLADGMEGQYESTILAEYSSVFGNIKVVDFTPLQEGPVMRAYLQDGTVQNRTIDTDLSVSMYTYVLDRFAYTFAPNAERALVLGHGAGMVPRDLKRRGMDVSIVEINPDSIRASIDYFGFDSTGFDITVADARTQIRNCIKPYDVIIIDLFHGGNTPDYLMTKEFFHDVKDCLNYGGAVVMNALLDN